MRPVSLLIILAACGSPATTPAPVASPTSPNPPATLRESLSRGGPSAQAKPLDLTVRMRAERDKRTFGVAVGDALKTGDYVELFVTVNQPAYVYVVQFFPDHSSAVLFPDTGDRQLQPGDEVRIPEAVDELFQLDSKLGEENVYVLMSREPVAKADAAIAAEIDQIRTSGNPSDAKPPVTPDPPPRDPKRPAVVAKAGGKSQRATRDDRFLTLATRSLKKVKRPDGAPAVTGAADKIEDPLLVVRFTVLHQ